MNKYGMALLLAGTALVWGQAYSADEKPKGPLPLIPMPMDVEYGGDLFPFAHTLVSANEAHAPLARLLAADLSNRLDYSIETRVNNDIKGPELIVASSRSLSFSCPEPPGGDEAYALKTGPEGVCIRANEYRGLYWGTRTLLQLIGGGDNLHIPAVVIRDKPRFRRRGLLLDPARNFISIQYLNRMVELISDIKLNVLHLHITDDQGWRFESKIFPRLHEVGGTGIYYTQEELRELVAYAKTRGVEILPEIDMPGHATAMMAAYPELSCSGKKIEVPDYFGIMPHALCPGKDEVYDFIEKLLGEVAGVFDSEFIHIGSDEVMAYDWFKSDDCKRLMVQLEISGKEGLHEYFVKRVNVIINKLGKRMIAWDEVAPFAPKNVVIQAWRKREYAELSTGLGHETIISLTKNAYLNYPRTFTPLRQSYEYEPVPPGLSPEQEALILGGSGNMWGEMADSEKDIHKFIFPRLIALAEVFWTPKEERDFEDFKKRLEPVQASFEKRGVKFGDSKMIIVKDTLIVAKSFSKAVTHFIIDYIKK